MKRLSGICILLGLASACSPIKYESRLESGELVPILNQNNLQASDPSENRREVTDVEDLAKRNKPDIGVAVTVLCYQRHRSAYGP